MKKTGFKWVFRNEPGSHFRIIRMWRNYPEATSGEKRSETLSIGITPKFASLTAEFSGWIMSIIFVRLHWKSSHGGFAC